MRWLLVAALAGGGLLFVATGMASAQGVVNKPIDTEQLIVKPAAATTSIVGGTFRYISRVAADLIDSNGYIKTFNNLFGRTTDPKATTQPGYSPLPLAGSYPSTGYKNQISPAMPRSSVYGQTPR